MIERFRGEYAFLSNMQPLDYVILTPRVHTYAFSSEHAYQAAKFIDKGVHRAVAHVTALDRGYNEKLDGIAAKNFAHELLDAGEPVHPEWDTEMKLAVMEDVVLRKFIANPRLLKLLVATGNETIVEGNTWGDRFWGVDPIGSDNGENHLGIILMDVRKRLARQATK